MDFDCRGIEKRLAFEMRCYQRLCNISYKDHVTNKEVCRKIQAGLAKTILQGTVKGKRRGGHKKRWKDNIKEWTGMEFVSSARAAENRTRWKGIVANSSVVP